MLCMFICIYFWIFQNSWINRLTDIHVGGYEEDMNIMFIQWREHEYHTTSLVMPHHGVVFL
jgi:hypothetical protein